MHRERRGAGGGGGGHGTRQSMVRSREMGGGGQGTRGSGCNKGMLRQEPVATDRIRINRN